MLTRCVAAEHGDDGIRANCVCPGGVETDMQAHMHDEPPTWVSQTTHQDRTYQSDPPIRTFADPMAIPDVVTFLASDEACSMTGAVVMAGGGLEPRGSAKERPTWVALPACVAQIPTAIRRQNLQEC